MLSGVVVFYVGLRESSVNTKRFKKLLEKERAFEAQMRDMESGTTSQARNDA